MTGLPLIRIESSGCMDDAPRFGEGRPCWGQCVGQLKIDDWRGVAVS